MVDLPPIRRAIPHPKLTLDVTEDGRVIIVTRDADRDEYLSHVVLSIEETERMAEALLNLVRILRGGEAK